MYCRWWRQIGQPAVVKVLEKLANHKWAPGAIMMRSELATRLQASASGGGTQEAEDLSPTSAMACLHTGKYL
jgi:hypothetical protein